VRIFFGIILLLAAIPLSCKAQGTGIATIIEPESQVNVPSPSIIHGAGFARLSNYNPERSFQQARENAVIDLEASILTSVYLEYYGTGAATRLQSEFSISDSIQTSQIAVVDSAIIGDWAVFFISDIDRQQSFPTSAIQSALNTNWAYELYEPRKFDDYWVSSGMNEQTRFNPGRGWTKAKQNALQNLSEYLNTSIQSLERAYNDDLSSVRYVTSKHVFNDIGVIGRKMIDGTYYVLVIVKDEDIIRIDG
jgi:hypothetical protein